MRELTLQTLERLGGAQEIVRTHLDATLTSFSQAERYALADLFHQLVTPSGTKIAHSAHDLAGYVPLSETEITRLLDKLAGSDTRILRAVPPPPGERGPSRYEIFHDVLAPAILDWRGRQDAARQARKQFRRRVLAALGVAGAAVIALIVFLAISAVNARNQANAAAARARAAQQRAVLVSDQNARLAANNGKQSRRNAMLAEKNAKLAGTYKQQRIVADVQKRRANQNEAAARRSAALASQLAAVNAAQAATQASLATRAQRSAKIAELSLMIANEAASLSSITPVIGTCVILGFTGQSDGVGFTQIEVTHVPPGASVTADAPGALLYSDPAMNPLRPIQTVPHAPQSGTVHLDNLASNCALGNSYGPIMDFGQKLLIFVEVANLGWLYEGSIVQARNEGGNGVSTNAKFSSFKFLQQKTCRTPGSIAPPSQVPLVCQPLP